MATTPSEIDKKGTFKTWVGHAGVKKVAPYWEQRKMKASGFLLGFGLGRAAPKQGRTRPYSISFPSLLDREKEEEDRRPCLLPCSEVAFQPLLAWEAEKGS